MSRYCAGRCCAVFSIPYTYEQMKIKAPDLKDGVYVLDMLIPLSADEAEIRSNRFGIPNKRTLIDQMNNYTCKHWDETSGRCEAYESRPQMCRTYGVDGEPCQHGCLKEGGGIDA